MAAHAEAEECEVALVVEPTGCLGFAAAHARRHSLAGKRVGIVLSGGNVDIASYGAMLAG